MQKNLTFSCPVLGSRQYTVTVYYRVGNRVLLHSERIVPLHSFKAHNVLLRSFFEFLATYETQKNVKERKERNILLQRMQPSFGKNVKERKERNILLQRT